MSPTLTGSNVTNGTTAYTEPLADPLSGLARCQCASDFTHGLLSQFVIPTTLTTVHPMSNYRIAGVIGVGPKVEMFGPDTTLVVAMMQDQEIAWDGAIGEFEHDAVRSCLPAAPRERSITSTTGAPKEMRAVPFPATFATNDSLPETAAVHPRIIQAFH